MTKIKYLLIFIILLSTSLSYSQDQRKTLDTSKKNQNILFDKKTNTLDIHFNGFAFLDDHEYDALIPLRKTISGTRTEFDLGLNVDSLNHFVFGTNALHEFGGVPYFVRVDPVIYYSYTSKNLLFNAGEFPRNQLLDYPRSLLNDTVQYFRPNVQGLLLRANTSMGYETGWIDWWSRQTPTERNIFMAGEIGKFIPFPNHVLYLSHYFLFQHNAGSKSDTAGNIRDSGGAQFRLGLNLSHKTVFDSLKIEAGVMGTEYRERSVYGFRLSEGFIASFFISYHKVALFDEFYKGDPNFLTFSDPFYSKPIYNRLDFIYTAFLGKHFKGQFILGLHQSPGRLTDSQPGFKVVYDFGRKVLARFSDN
jgi:hypothetical protein